MLHEDPETRISLDDVLKHPWMLREWGYERLVWAAWLKNSGISKLAMIKEKHVIENILEFLRTKIMSQSSAELTDTQDGLQIS